PVWSVAFSPDGKSLLTASGDERAHKREARLWEVPSGKLLGVPCSAAGPGRLPLGGHVSSLATFSKDGQSILFVGGGDAQVWTRDKNADAGGAFSGLTLAHPEEVLTATFDREGRTVVTGGVDGTARRWDAATGKALGSPLQHGATDGSSLHSIVVTAAFS